MKTPSSPTGTIDSYIAGFAPPVQRSLKKIRALIRKLAPDAQEAIKYGIPTFVLHENLVHFAAFKKHIGFYPSSQGIKAFEKKLSAYATSKGAVQFPLDQPVPLDLVQLMVEYRVKQARAKHAAKLKKSKPQSPRARRK